MKIFEENGKINFVDKNNVFVGFDYCCYCCEDFGYHIDNKEIIKEDITRVEEKYDDSILNDYIFDTNYYEDTGEVAIFKLTSNNKQDLYLHLYNYHNGYYSHGFKFKDNCTTIQSGYL